MWLRLVSLPVVVWYIQYIGDRFIFYFDFFRSLSVVFRGVFVFVLPCRNTAAFAANVV